MDEGDENIGNKDVNEYDGEGKEEVGKEDDKACRGGEDAITEGERSSGDSDSVNR